MYFPLPFRHCGKGSTISGRWRLIFEKARDAERPGGAAQMLQMPPTTLHSMIKRLGIQKVYAE